MDKYVIFDKEVSSHDLIMELTRLGKQSPRLAMVMVNALYSGALSEIDDMQELALTFETLFAVADMQKSLGRKPHLNPELIDKLKKHEKLLSFRWDLDDLRKAYCKGD